MLHIWLIPVLVVFAALVLGFYLLLAAKGGSGQRTEGRKLVHKPMPEEDLPPG